MLRTCSEPDLSKLFRTTLAENPFFAEDERAVDLEDDDDDDECQMSLDLEALRAQLDAIEDEDSDEEDGQKQVGSFSCPLGLIVSMLNLIN